jgi:subtilisin family serine protease
MQLSVYRCKRPNGGRAIADAPIIPGGTSVKIERIDQNVYLDPRLQVTLDRYARRTIRAALSSDALGDIAVVAVVNDPKVCEERTDLRPVAEIGKTRDDKNWIFTARVPLSRVADIRNDPRVVSLKGAQQTMQSLHATVPEILAAPSELPSGATRQGEGVVLGIIDYGCDFAHLNFRNPDGTTRIDALWDQSGGLQAQSQVQYGRVYTKIEIDAALRSADPYATLGYNPDPNRQGMHGTHVMDIAAGSGGGTAVPGVAPKATIVFVHLSTDDIPWTGEGSLTTKLGDSVHLLEALAWIFQTADGRPCVVNISLGTNGGPHDGSTPFEQGLDALVAKDPGRSVVIAAANAYADRIHATGTVAANAAVDLEWVIPRTGPGPNEMEIWYAGADEFEFELLDDRGTSFGSVKLGDSARVTDDNGQTLVFISHRKKDPLNGDNVIGIFLEGTLQQTLWTVRLHGRSVTTNGEFHAWIERNDAIQTQFRNADDSHTLGSLSCGHNSIVVSSYDGHYPSAPISWFSSAGPTRDGRQKPEISAPGQDVIAARSVSSNGVIRMSGTSMAAPAVAGAIAVMLSEASGSNMQAQDIRNAVITSARMQPPPMGATWDPRYGHGRVSTAAMVTQVLGAQRAQGIAASRPIQSQVTAAAAIGATGGTLSPPAPAVTVSDHDAPLKKAVPRPRARRTSKRASPNPSRVSGSDPTR